MDDSQVSRQAGRLGRIPIPVLIAALAISLVALAVIGGKLRGYDRALECSRTQAGLGILALELAFTEERAGALLEGWALGPSGDCQGAAGVSAPLVSRAKASVRLDFGLILAYAVFGPALLVLLLRASAVPIDAFWTAVAALPLLAGVADLIENALLWMLLTAGTAQPAVVLAAGVLALLKFVLIALALFAAFAVAGFWLFSRSAQRTADETPQHLLSLASVIDRERAYLRGRRRKAGLAEDEDAAPVGLALSGGGIRAATLSMGVLQSLAHSGLFRRIDYLSTVSGGGYIGSALSSLLSCRELDRYLGPDEPAQYEFGAGERPHFDVASPQDNPFLDDQRTPRAPHRQWLSGRMVVLHLRAFGEYLVRRSRALDRDVLRALGTVLTGMLSTLALFFHVLLIGAAAALLGVAVTGGAPFPGFESEGVAGYLSGLVNGAGGLPALVWAALVGGLFSVSAGAACGLGADRTPRTWFRRDGDGYEESRQRRALWVLGVLAVPAAFAVPAVLRLILPGVVNGLLLPPVFFAGGFLAAALTYVALVALVPGSPKLRSNRNSRSYVGSIIGLSLYFVLAAAGLVALTALLGALAEAGQSGPPTGALAEGGGAALIGAVVSGLLAWWRGRKGEGKGSIKAAVGWVRTSTEVAQKLALGLAVLVLIVAGLAFSMVVVEQVLRWAGAREPGAGHYLAFIAAAGALLVVLGFALDFNKLSLHYFYRDRLVEAFLRTLARRSSANGHSVPEVRRDHGEMRLLDLHGRMAESAKASDGSATAPGAKAGRPRPPGETFVQYRLDASLIDRLQVWKALAPEGETFAGAATAAPYHLYSACLNLATDRDPAYRSRRSDIFLLSKLYCGSRVTGYVDTGVYRSGETKVARAMTISGAAVDSAIGRQGFFAQSFATTLFNIRLGQWQENPSYRNGRHAGRRETGVFWPQYLLMEILGMSDARHRLVHLSDGGHTGDNLGLIPLLQRRCRLILAVDAECDTDYGFGSLINALQYAEVDLGIGIDIDLSVLRPDAEGRVASHYAVGGVAYPETDTLPAGSGHLVVLKSSVHDADHATVLKYRQSHPVFPQETTGDQFFSEEQFEAYRKLGQNMAQALLHDHPELDGGSIALA